MCRILNKIQEYYDVVNDTDHIHGTWSGVSVLHANIISFEHGQSALLHQTSKQNLIIYELCARSKLLNFFGTEVILLEGSRNLSRRKQSSRLQKFKLILRFGQLELFWPTLALSVTLSGVVFTGMTVYLKLIWSI